MHPMKMITAVVRPFKLDELRHAIANVSRTGRPGDGRIVVGDLEQTIRIRTGETGTAAT